MRPSVRRLAAAMRGASRVRGVDDVEDAGGAGPVRVAAGDDGPGREDLTEEVGERGPLRDGLTSLAEGALEVERAPLPDVVGLPEGAEGEGAGLPEAVRATDVDGVERGPGGRGERRGRRRGGPARPPAKPRSAACLTSWTSRAGASGSVERVASVSAQSRSMRSENRVAPRLATR